MTFPIEKFLSPNLTNMLVTLVIPFLIFFTILLVVLKRTRIFGDSNFVYVLISLGLTIMIYAVNPGNVFQFLASYLFQIGVAGTVIALGGIIFILFWNLIKHGVNIAAKAGTMNLESVIKEEKKLQQNIMKERNTDKRINMVKRLEELERRERALRYRR